MDHGLILQSLPVDPVGRWRMAIHVLPIVWLLLSGLALCYGLPAEAKLEYYRGGKTDDSPSATYFAWVFFSQICLYFCAATWTLLRFRIHHFAHSSVTRVVPLGWVVTVLVVIGSYLVLFAAANFLPDPVASVLRHVDYIIVLSVLIHGLAVMVLRHPGMLELDTSRLAPNAEPPLTSRKYRTSSLRDDDARRTAADLEEIMTSEHLYEDPELKLADVSARLGIPSHHLSQVLNQQLAVNFYTFVNRYRVEAVKKLLRGADGDRFSLPAIALEVGFNSKASFNRVFKQEEGVTPTQYARAARSTGAES